MKINMKVRLQNKAFWISMGGLIVTFAYQVLSLIGITPAISQDSITQIIGIVINLLGMMGVLIDPTTPGARDSQTTLKKTDIEQSAETIAQSIKKASEPEIIAIPDGRKQ